MTKHRRKFSKEAKLKILKEASTQGIRNTLDKYGLYPSTYYTWKKKFQDMGEEGFAHGMTKECLQKIKELEQEKSNMFLFVRVGVLFWSDS